MKNYILTLVTVFISNISFAQGSVIQWQKSLGGSNQDQAFSIQQASDGGYIVVGNTTSNNGEVTGYHGGYSDIWVVKLTDTGSIQWENCLGGSNGFEDAHSVITTLDGGYIVAGSSSTSNGDVTGNHGGYDFWIVKLSSTGSIQWEKSLGGSRNEYSYSIRQTLDGGYIVAGYTYSNNGDVTINHGGFDYWVVKLNDTGAIQWQKSLGGSHDEVAYSIQQTSEGGYIVAGYSYSYDGDVTGHRGNIIDSLGIHPDYWVVKLNDTGAIQWQKSLGGSGDEIAYSIQQTPEGGYIVAGYSSSNDSDVSGNHGNRDYWIVKLNDTGAIQWQKCLGGSLEDQGKSIIVASDGSYIIAGYTLSNDGEVTGNHGGWDFWIVKLNNTGAMIWEKSYGGTSDDLPYAIQQTTDGGYVIGGCSLSNNGDVTGNHGLYDYWIIKLSGTLGVNTINNNKAIAVLPNPTNGNITIINTYNVNIKVYNLLGQLIKSAYNTDNISIAEFQTGIYFVRVFNEKGEILKQEKIIKQ